MHRIVWTLEGPLEESVYVNPPLHHRPIPEPPHLQLAMPDMPRTVTGIDMITSIDVLTRDLAWAEPYYRVENGTWHPVGDEPVSKPPVSSVSVEIDTWSVWESEWGDVHIPDCSSDRSVVSCPEEECDFSDDDGKPVQLTKCCGERRPAELIPLTVHASTKPFVTVHDYLTAVHPWLRAKRPELLRAISIWNAGLTYREETRLRVQAWWPSSVRIEGYDVFSQEQQALILRNMRNESSPAIIRDMALMTI